MVPSITLVTDARHRPIRSPIFCLKIRFTWMAIFICLITLIKNTYADDYISKRGLLPNLYGLSLGWSQIFPDRIFYLFCGKMVYKWHSYCLESALWDKSHEIRDLLSVCIYAMAFGMVPTSVLNERSTVYWNDAQ